MKSGISGEENGTASDNMHRQKTHTRQIPSIGKALPGMQNEGLLTPPSVKHSRSLSATIISPFDSYNAITPIQSASSLFSDFPTPDASPFRTNAVIDETLQCMGLNQAKFDELLTIPHRPRTIDPNILLRRKSIHEKSHHSTSQLDHLYGLQLPTQGFLNKKASNEGFLDIVGRLGSSFETYRHQRHDSNCSSIQSSALTPPLPPRDLSIGSSQDFIASIDNTISEISMSQLSDVFMQQKGVVEEEAMQLSCLWEGCEKIFKGQSELVNHISDDHVGSGKSEYFCEWKNCTRKGMAFAKRHKIHNHIRIHTGERPFICRFPGCNKKFSRQDGLYTHTKTHTNIKPYTCRFPGCKKAYYHSRSLKKHEKSHTGEVSIIINDMDINNEFSDRTNWNESDLHLLSNRFNYFPNH